MEAELLLLMDLFSLYGHLWKISCSFRSQNYKNVSKLMDSSGDNGSRSEQPLRIVLLLGCSKCENVFVRWRRISFKAHEEAKRWITHFVEEYVDVHWYSCERMTEGHARKVHTTYHMDFETPAPSNLDNGKWMQDAKRLVWKGRRKKMAQSYNDICHRAKVIDIDKRSRVQALNLSRKCIILKYCMCILDKGTKHQRECGTLLYPACAMLSTVLFRWDVLLSPNFQ